MLSGSRGRRSQLFSLRLWSEEMEDGRTEWRGKVERIVSGETLYFRDWNAMLDFLRGEPASAVAADEQEQHVKEADGQN